MPVQFSFELSSASVEDLVVRASEVPVLDDREQARLVSRLDEGHDEALTELVHTHLRVAVDEAIRNRGLGLPQHVLVRAAARALVEAAPSYDRARHGPFDEYARSCVRDAIRRALAT